MNAQQFLKLCNMTPEERDAKRLREIQALNEAGVATYEEIREANEIRRRQVIRGLDKE